MTDLKMCMKGRATINAKVIGDDGWSIKAQEFDIDYWVPIEPQPSCDNCGKQQTQNGVCPIFDLCESMLTYCSEWVPNSKTNI